MHGKASPGRLLAIMGPSGAGKTTLLNTIAGQLPRNKNMKLTGQLLVDGVNRIDSNIRFQFLHSFYFKTSLNQNFLLLDFVNSGKHL